jgi:uncharacterized protein (TIGR04255 family)
MDSTGPKLPSYAKPPLIEVVCGVQFEEIPAFSSAHYGLFWEAIREEYPTTEDRAPLAQILESAGGTEIRTIVIEATQPPPIRRVFYVDRSQNYLIQLQPSRLLTNWRKVRDDDEYPRFSTALERFQTAWQKFSAFLKRQAFAQARGTQYELTYINHLVAENETFPAAIEKYISMVSWPTELRPPDTAAFKLRFPMTGGFMHLTLNHGKREKDGKAVVVVDLTARGPARDDFADLGDWFQRSHENIVRAFDWISTDEAHRLWEKQS